MIVDIPYCTCGLGMAVAAGNDELFYCTNCDTTQETEYISQGVDKYDNPIYYRNQTGHDLLFKINTAVQMANWFPEQGSF